MDDKLGDTEYYASTDYNQRLEEQAELFFEAKNNSDDKYEIQELNSPSDIDVYIANNNLNELYKIASNALCENDFIKLINLNDKDLHIQIARNTSITSKVAEQLIGTVYLAHKNLLENPTLDTQVKSKLINKLNENAHIYKDLISIHS